MTGSISFTPMAISVTEHTRLPTEYEKAWQEREMRTAALIKVARFVNRLGSELLYQASQKGRHVSALNASFAIATLMGTIYAGITDPELAKKMHDRMFNEPQTPKETAAAREKGEHEIKHKNATATGEMLSPGVVMRALADLKTILTFRGGNEPPYAIHLNALVLNPQGDVIPDFRKLMEDELKAKVFTHAQRGDIGPWLRSEAPKQLHEMLGKVLEGDMLASNSAADAIDLIACTAFKANWEQMLPEYWTKDVDFQRSDGSRIRVKGMEAVIKHNDARACFIDGHTVVALPYKGHNANGGSTYLKYVIILPHDPSKIWETEKNAHEIIEKSSKFLSSGSSTPLHIFLPKQELESDEDRKEALLAEGYPIDAPMLGMLPPSVTCPWPHIEKFSDRVVGRVNEQGAEFVARARVVVTRGDQAPAGTPLCVDALQPFVACVVAHDYTRVGSVALLMKSIKGQKFLVPGEGTPADTLILRSNPLPLEGVEKMTETDQWWQLIKQPIAHIIRDRPVRSAVAYTVNGKDPGTEAQISIVNYSSRKVALNIRREILVDDSAIFYRLDGTYAEPIYLGRDTCNVIIFERNGHLCFIDQDIGQPAAPHYWVISHDATITQTRPRSELAT